MAYDRYDTRDAPRGRPRFEDRNERGFFDRAGDEIASWFGDEEAERRRREDQMRYEREQRSDPSRGFASDRGPERGRGWSEPYRVSHRGGFSEGDYNPSWRRELSGGRDWDRDPHGRSEQFFAASGMSDYDRSQSPWARDEYRRTSRAGTADWSDRSRHEDPHYNAWRQRHMDELDRDYEDYRRENQARFESDFGSWRERRMHKRGMLGQIREHMEVVGSDNDHVGTIDCVAGDRIILTKSDPESGGIHHSLSCSDIDRIEGDRVILDLNADQARQRWRDESRSGALFEREEQGDTGPRAPNRNVEGTYR